MKKSIGLVKTKCHTFAGSPHEMVLTSGKKLGPIRIAYETYGTLNKDRSNAILILHALSGDAHAAGYHTKNDKKPGWWDNMIGPGKGFDTDQYFIICSNIIGGCMGSTGPNTINPKTKKLYATDFPVITIRDMVNAQKYLIDYLGIEKLFCLAGGSMGGMQVLQWTLSYPEMCRSAMAIATAPYLSAQAIAFDEVGRRAVISDPNWTDGHYYKKSKIPAQGLAIARMVGHITYLSEESMHKKFGRRLQNRKKYSYDFLTEFQVESYLRYQGDSFVKRFDANSYLYITKAMDYFNISDGYTDINNAFKCVMAKYLVISFSSDWLFTPAQGKEIVKALRNNSKDVSYVELQSSYGHDAFLLEVDRLTIIVKEFLRNLKKEI